MQTSSSCFAKHESLKFKFSHLQLSGDNVNRGDIEQAKVPFLLRHGLYITGPQFGITPDFASRWVRRPAATPTILTALTALLAHLLLGQDPISWCDDVAAVSEIGCSAKGRLTGCESNF